MEVDQWINLMNGVLFFYKKIIGINYYILIILKKVLDIIFVRVNYKIFNTMNSTIRYVSVFFIFALSAITFTAKSLTIFSDENRNNGKTGGAIMTSRSFNPIAYIQVKNYSGDILFEATTNADIISFIENLPSDKYIINCLDGECNIISSVVYTK